MKQFVTLLIFLGLACMVFAQKHNDRITAVTLDAITVSPVNVDYMRKVNDGNTPEVVKELQYKAANFDVTSLYEYDKKDKHTFEVVFKASNGDIIASYTSDGSIVTAFENFENIVLPMTVRKMVFDGNEGWKMEKNRYKCVFSEDNLTKKQYKVTLTDGHQKKKMTLDFDE
ncbi:hypothetical protein MWU78_08860 [Arenibacter sp. F26102]|uniref:hypothetical protein n=1 Tax=Arenibacter sp. F26102 TaxID=2926416 RepID=UPI001FF53BA0|nr:hypothetical protein [Arenibacter sp. F26102]MCK0145750.1 hypothetical protein [Arenibacter sp. F26102]